MRSVLLRAWQRLACIAEMRLVLLHVCLAVLGLHCTQEEKDVLSLELLHDCLVQRLLMMAVHTARELARAKCFRVSIMKQEFNVQKGFESVISCG